ncbi:hypothetical protein IP88_02235 [alpha proteobacterium AAP81b]|nr:hypothetical protein IP88_02235 [alpha proteobacterium AAP81b]
MPSERWMISDQTAFIIGGTAATLLALGGLWMAIKAPNAAARFRGRLMVVAAAVIAFNVWINSLPLPATGRHSPPVSASSAR